MLINDDIAFRLIDSVPDALVVTNTEGRIVYANARCETMFGYARAELVSQPIEVLVPEQRREAHRLAYDGFARAPVARPMGTGMRLAGRRKDGTELPIDVSLGSIQTANAILFMAAIRDMTERVRAEEELRRSEQRYRELFESAPDGIFMATTDGRYTDVNAAGCRLLGYTREELIGRSITELVAPDALPRQATLTRRLVEGGTEVSEWELRRKDGTFVPVELSSNALPDGQLRGFVRDISKRRRAEDTLRRSEDSLAMAQRVAHIGSFDWNLRTNAVERSLELCALFGFGPETRTAAAGTLLDLVHPQDRERVQEALAAASRDARSYRLEHRIVRRDGTERVVLHQGDAVMEGADIVRLVGTMLDITDRKRIEEERAESHRQLEAVLDQTPVGILIVGAHGEPPRLNAYGQRLLGWASEHIGKVSDILLTPDRHVVEPKDRPGARALRGERVEPVEYLVRQPDGSMVSVSANGAPVLDPSGAIQGAVVGFLDITAMKQLERLRVEWSAIVAHDLRQPLHGIVLRATMIARALAGAAGAPFTRALDAANAILRSAERLNRMIADLLDLSQLEAGRVMLMRSPTDLVKLVRGTVELLRSEENAAPFDVRVVGEIPLVNVDPDRIAQVLENLVSNAVKYGAAGTAVVVEIEAVANRVCVAVTNQGQGIPPEDLGRLFRRFARAEDARTSQVKGIGLGLYITKELVAAHGGEIAAESVPGGLTTFRFTIPIQTPTEER